MIVTLYQKDIWLSTNLLKNMKIIICNVFLA